MTQKWAWVIIAAMVVLDAWVGVALWHAQAHVLTVAFLDIGQGDSIFIQSPSGHQALIDAGPGQKVLERLGSVMPWYDRSLDLVIATHPDADHVGGIPAVFDKYAVADFMEPGIVGTTQTYAAYENAVAHEHAPSILARRGQVINFGDGAYLKILFPDRDIQGNDTNMDSIVAQLVYGDTEVMLTGDSPKAVEHYLVGLDGAGLKSDILKAGHHGSHTSSSQEFVNAVSPEYAIISAGKNNRYGHPHADTLEILRAAHAQILSTIDKGTITFTSDGKHLTIKK